MDALKVYPSLRASRGESVDNDVTTDSSSGSLFADRLGFFLFVASAVALVMVVTFYLTYGASTYTANSEIEISLNDINDNFVKISVPDFDDSSVSRSYAYMLPASFESRTTNSMQTEELDKEHTQVRFLTNVIKSTSNIETTAKLARIIVSESKRHGYDPLFVAAVIHAESNFNKKAISSKGALGLMQLLPTTAQYVTKSLNIANWKGDKHLLVDEAYNINLGISYLKYLGEKFNGDKKRMLVAYNWGPGNMERALKGKANVPTVSQEYRDKILGNYKKWSKQYRQLETASLIGNISSSIAG